MPIFEYRCEGCGRKFERIVLGAREGKSPCPGCGSKETEKLVSRFAMRGGSRGGSDEDFDDIGGEDTGGDWDEEGGPSGFDPESLDDDGGGWEAGDEDGADEDFA